MNSQTLSQRSLSCIMHYFFGRCWHFQIPSPSANNKRGGKLLSGPDRVTFVIMTIIYFSSLPLFLTPRFWEPLGQPQPLPQPGFFPEAREIDRERESPGNEVAVSLLTTVTLVLHAAFFVSSRKEGRSVKRQKRLLRRLEREVRRLQQSWLKQRCIVFFLFFVPSQASR